MNYDKELEFAKNLALEAGGIMMRYFRAEDIATEWKEDNTPLTIADTTINKLVIDQVKKSFPEHGVLGEEESFESERDTIWVVDPIDGTVPFSLGIPIFTFSIALVSRKDGQPVVAVTHDPWLNEMFWATKSGGTFMNDRPLKTSTATSFSKAYLVMGGLTVQGEGVEYNAARAVETVRAQGGKTMSIQSGVYLSNRIASGQFVGAIIGHPKVWDIAASALLVKEAGGIVTNLKGEKRRFDEPGLGIILACNPIIFKKLMALVEAKA